MSHGHSPRSNDHLLTNVVAGMVGGLVGSWVMDRFQEALGRLSHGGGRQGRQPEAEPATYKAADAVARTLTGRRLPDEYKPAAGALIHYAFGGAVGAIYGAAAARQPDVTAWGGLPFGATLWVTADEMGVPLSGLSKSPTAYPLSNHATAFATHLVYGATTEAVRRLLVKSADHYFGFGAAEGASGRRSSPTSAQPLPARRK